MLIMGNCQLRGGDTSFKSLGVVTLEAPKSG